MVNTITAFILEDIVQAIGDYLELALNWFADAFKWIGDSINSFYVWAQKVITEFYTNFFSFLVDSSVEMFKKVFFFFMDKLAQITLPKLEEILADQPDLILNVNAFGHLVAKINYWLPLDYFFLLFTSFIGFCAVVTIVRFILKLIPTIG